MGPGIPRKATAMLFLQVACEVLYAVGFSHKFHKFHLNDGFLLVLKPSRTLVLVAHDPAAAAARLLKVLLTLLLLIAVPLTVLPLAVMPFVEMLLFQTGGGRLSLFLLFCGAALTGDWSAAGMHVRGVNSSCLGLTGMGDGEAFEDPVLSRSIRFSAGTTTSAQEGSSELRAVVGYGRGMDGWGGDLEVGRCHARSLLLIPLLEGNGREQFDLSFRVSAICECLELPSPRTSPVLPCLASDRAG